MSPDAEPTALETVTSIDGAAPGTGVRRLPFVDGVRGFAAIIVLLGHLIFTVPSTHEPTLLHAGVGDLLVWPFRFGREMVYLFLIVSGFSLHYSEVVRRSKGRAPTTYRQFAARRAWRIGPVYYVAFGLGLVVTRIVSNLELHPGEQSWGDATVGGVLSHLVLVHNLHGAWQTQINGPLWSLAYEVQLYLLFPLIFWAVRRWNPLIVCGSVAALDLWIYTEGHLEFPVFGLARWFALGILLAELTARGVRIPLKISLPIGLAALLVGAAQFRSIDPHTTSHDMVWAVAFAGIMLALIERADSASNPFAWRPMRWLGLRSYSIYALHWPIVMLLILASTKLGLSGWGASAAVVAVGLPAALILAAISFRFVEGPSLERVARVGRPADQV